MMRRRADAAGSRGAALVEAALALPLFLALVLALLETSTVMRKYIGVLEALSQAERAVTAVSATADITDQDLLLKAGDVFVRVLEAKGVSLQEVGIGKDGADQPYILLGIPFAFPAGEWTPPPGYSQPGAYELRAVYKPRCLTCRLPWFHAHRLQAAAMAVRETPTRNTGVPVPAGQVRAYFPGYSGDRRAAPVRIS